MPRGQLLWRLAIVLLLSVPVPCSARAEEPRQGQPETVVGADVQCGECGAVLAALEEQQRKLHQELRQIKREIGLLNQNLEKPGAREIIAGVGFILGLFGAVALLMARRRSLAGREH